MIICSCNVLSDRDVHQAIAGAGDESLSAKTVHRCLGCQLKCGRCVASIRRILDVASKVESPGNRYDGPLPPRCVNPGISVNSTASIVEAFGFGTEFVKETA